MARISLASQLQFDSIVDGPGIRMVIWTQGCTHNCKGCHNPHTHDIRGGFKIDVEELIQNIQEAKLQTGLTLSGGEPFLQSVELLPVVQASKKKGLDVWAYSGFTYEQLRHNPSYNALLEEIDILVDGKFIEELKDYRLTFKGSKNQRIIDVKESLKRDKVILSSYDDNNQNLN